MESQVSSWFTPNSPFLGDAGVLLGGRGCGLVASILDEFGLSTPDTVRPCHLIGSSSRYDNINTIIPGCYKHLRLIGVVKGSLLIKR